MISKECKVECDLKRGRIDIMENILSAANGRAKKTRIMYACNLSFKQFHAYLDLLVSMGLLKPVALKTEGSDDSSTYETTEKGQGFIQAYRNLNALCSSESEVEVNCPEAVSTPAR